jgi:hypothetical protein
MPTRPRTTRRAKQSQFAGRATSLAENELCRTQVRTGRAKQTQFPSAGEPPSRYGPGTAERAKQSQCHSAEKRNKSIVAQELGWNRVNASRAKQTQFPGPRALPCPGGEGWRSVRNKANFLRRRRGPPCGTGVMEKPDQNQPRQTKPIPASRRGTGGGERERSPHEEGQSTTECRPHPPNLR